MANTAAMGIMARWRHVWTNAIALRAIDEDADTPVTPTTPPALATLDSARQKKARRYARQRQTLMLANLAISAVVIAVLLFSGLSFWLRDALSFAAGWRPIADWEPLRTGLYFIVVSEAGGIREAGISW